MPRSELLRHDFEGAKGAVKTALGTFAIGLLGVGVALMLHAIEAIAQ